MSALIDSVISSNLCAALSASVRCEDWFRLRSVTHCSCVLYTDESLKFEWVSGIGWNKEVTKLELDRGKVIVRSLNCLPLATSIIKSSM